MAHANTFRHAQPAPASRLPFVFSPWPEEAAPGLPDDPERWRLSEDDEVNPSRPQTLAIRRLWPCVERRLAELRREWMVGTDQTMNLDGSDLRIGVRPDLYVLPGRPADESFEAWPAYQPGVPPPVLAIEIVSSSNWGKDYNEAPARYATLGTEELVLFDPLAPEGRSPAPNPEVLQVYRRSETGKLVRVYQGAGPAWSEVLQAWLLPDESELGLSRDQQGRDPVMTPEEGEAWWRTEALAHAEKLKQAEAALQSQAQAGARELRRAEEEKLAAARAVVADMCELLDLPLDEARRARLEAAGEGELAALRAHLKAHRRWPG